MPMLDPETQAYLDRLRPQADAQRARTLAPYGAAAAARGYNTHGEYQQYQDAKGKRDFLMKAVLPTVAAFGGGAIGSALGGGAGTSAAAASGGGYSSPGVFGGLFGGGAAGGGGVPWGALAQGPGRFSLGSLLRMAEIGVPAVSSVLGMRSQNKANDRMFAAEQANLAEQMAYAREQEAFRRSEADRVAKEEQRRWEIEQANRARELAAAEEERAFNRRLIEEREARNQQKRMALAEFLRMGR